MIEKPAVQKGFLEKNKTLIVALLLLGAVALSMQAHSLVLREWHMPTYGNTMIHVASARHLVEHGEYPFDNDYSYGGGHPNLYVPLYRFLAAEGVVLSGLSFDVVSRLLVLFFALLLPLGFFLLGRILFNDWVGVLAAFFASLVPELLIYTVRPLPQAFGMVLLPIGFYLVARDLRWQAALFAVFISLVHQEAGVVFVGCVFAAFVFLALTQSLREKRVVFSSFAQLCLLCWFAGTAAYLAWHFAAVGNVDLLGLAQFTQHEGNVVDLELLTNKTGVVVTALGAVGIIAALVLATVKALKEKDFSREVFALSLAAAGVFLIKNDLIGLNVFMDRFIVFLDEALILFAAVGLYYALDFARTALATNFKHFVNVGS